MQVTPTEIPDVKLIIPKKHGDHRGFFSETYSRRLLTDAGISAEFVQDNHSMSAQKGVLRGLHYQLPPMAQDKLLRVVHGAILDVVVDVRRSSPTFGRHVRMMLSADNWRQLFVPIGFAHGFVTLEPNTEVLYKVSNYYSPAHERGLRWNDPKLAIDWEIDAASAVMSERDLKHPTLAEAVDLF